MKQIKALTLVLALVITTALLTTTKAYGREDVGKSPPTSMVKATTDQIVLQFSDATALLEIHEVGSPARSYEMQSYSHVINDAIHSAINYAIPKPERSNAVHNAYYLQRSSAWCANVPRPPLTVLPPDPRCTGYGLSTRSLAPVGKVDNRMSTESFARSRLS